MEYDAAQKGGEIKRKLEDVETFSKSVIFSPYSLLKYFQIFFYLFVLLLIDQRYLARWTMSIMCL